MPGNPGAAGLLADVPRGALDPAFGNNGLAVAPGGVNSTFVLALAPQKDGKIVEAGAINVNVNLIAQDLSAPSGQWFVARLEPDGKTLDPTFGNGGVVETTFVAGNVEAAESLVIQPDGKILVAGVSTTPGASDTSGASQAVVERLNADGSLDTTFGQGGKVVGGPLAVFSNAGTLALEGTQVLVGGASKAPFDAFGVVRLNADGSFDTTFGYDGLASAHVRRPAPGL